MNSRARQTRSSCFWDLWEDVEAGGEGSSLGSDVPFGGVQTKGAGGEDEGDATRQGGMNFLNDITQEAEIVL